MTHSARATLLVVLAGGLAATTAHAQDRGEIRIGLNNWAENVAVSNMWKILLEERGYSVELTRADKSVVYSGVASDSLDIGLEVWMPTTDKEFYERYEEDIDLHDAWYEGTGLGLVVPEYMDVDTLPELREARARFEHEGEPTIFGIDPGSALAGLTDEAVEAYDLEMAHLTSSETGMMSALDRAYRREEPVVVTLWNPHWAFADYELKYLEDPEGIFGQGENIHWMSRPELTEEHPELVEWLNRWQMGDDEIGSLMARINELDDPEAGAEAWIEDNRELVDSWF